MSEKPTYLSRLYLIPAIAVMILGPLAVRAHLRQPRYVPGPGLGCVVTTIPSPDRSRLPAAVLELHACPHINETTLQLFLDSPETGNPSSVFRGSGPEDPHKWAETLSIRWVAGGRVVVRYAREVTFLERRDAVRAVRFDYLPVREGGS